MSLEVFKSSPMTSILDVALTEPLGSVFLTSLQAY